MQPVLFDFGGVITSDPFRVMAKAAVEHGIDLVEFAEIAIGRGADGAGDHPWHQLERGEIDIDEFNGAVDQLARDRGHHGFPPLPVELIVGTALHLRSNVMELIADL